MADGCWLVLADTRLPAGAHGYVHRDLLDREGKPARRSCRLIPSGSTLAFSILTLPDDWQPVRLTAFRPRRAKRWGVRVTGIGNLEDAPAYPRTLPNWLHSIVPLMQSASWESADEAFAAIKEALQRATDLHLLAG